MDDLVKIPFKRSILVPEIQNELKEMDEDIRNEDMQYIYWKKLLKNYKYERTKVIPPSVKNYVMDNYTDKVAILDSTEVVDMLEIPSVTKLVDYNKSHSGSYGIRILGELFKYDEINKYYVTKITGAYKFDEKVRYDNCEWFITEYYVYLKFNEGDSFRDVYIFKLDENNNIIIPDFGNENIEIDVLLDDVLDTPETREILLNLIS